MSERSRPSRSRAFLRFVGAVFALGLTVAAAWMIALGHSQREESLGVITGLWAALIGALTLYSGRHAATAQPGSAPVGGGEIELRQSLELEVQREAASRRAYEQQLHEMVRREIETIQRVVGDQLTKLRDEVSTLRGDVVEKVGGQIRLERIETTRVIGSDIEALHNEVRQLAGGRPGDEGAGSSASGGSRSNGGGDRRGGDRRATPRPVVVDASPSDPFRRAERILPREPATTVTAPPSPVSDQAPSAPASGWPPPPVPPPATAGPAGPLAPARPATPPSYQPSAYPLLATSSEAALPPAVSVAAAAVPLPPAVPAPSAPQPAPYQPPYQPQPAYQEPQFQPQPPAQQPQPPAQPAQPPAAPAYQQPPAYQQYSPPPSAGYTVNGTSGYGQPSAPATAQPPAPSAAPPSGSDPFAGLPRLTPFSDVGAPARATPPAGWPSEPLPPPPAPPADGWSDVSVNGASPTGHRHAAEGGGPEQPSGGRRRRAEGDPNDVLARLLGDR